MSDVVERLAELRVVPVLTVDGAEAAEDAARALAAGGLPVVEVTFRTPAAAEAIARIAALGDVLVGAGTVRSPEQLEQAVAAGARFAVAPALDAAVVAAARDAGVPLVPGVATPSEIERALELGCDVLKLFPASIVGGVAFIKAVAPVYPGVRFVPTGGVSPENLASYLAHPSVLACGGTWICANADEIEERARAATEIALVAA